MDYETLRDSLDGLFAYDTGSTDSGIHDEALRERCKAHLQGLKDDDRRHLLGKMVAEMWLSEKCSCVFRARTTFTRASSSRTKIGFVR